MAPPRKWSALVSLIGIVIGVGFLVFRTYTRTETIIEGKPLSAWVRELGDPNFSAPNHEHAYEALVRQRPSLIPELLQSLAKTHGMTARLVKRLQKFGRRIKVGVTSEPFDPDVTHVELLRVISEIARRNDIGSDRRPECEANVQELTRQLKADRANAPGYFWVIGAFGVNARKSLPTLMGFIPANFSATNFLRISPMLRAIAQIGPGPYSPQVARAATNLLSSVERGNIDTALIALGSCGTNATPFIPQILERLQNRDEITGAAIMAMAQIGHIPVELKPRLADWVEHGSGPAAVAMLEIDPTQPTALNIVQARLHPLAGRDHTEMIQLVARVPAVAKLCVPELQRLAGKTNAPTSYLARQTLRELNMEGK